MPPARRARAPASAGGLNRRRARALPRSGYAPWGPRGHCPPRIYLVHSHHGTHTSLVYGIYTHRGEECWACTRMLHDEAYDDHACGEYHEY